MRGLRITSYTPCLRGYKLGFLVGIYNEIAQSPVYHRSPLLAHLRPRDTPKYLHLHLRLKVSTINVYKLKNTYIFKHYLGDTALFKQLADYCNGASYRFEAPRRSSQGRRPPSSSELRRQRHIESKGLHRQHRPFLKAQGNPQE